MLRHRLCVFELNVKNPVFAQQTNITNVKGILGRTTMYLAYPLLNVFLTFIQDLGRKLSAV